MHSKAVNLHQQTPDPNVTNSPWSSVLVMSVILGTLAIWGEEFSFSKSQIPHLKNKNNNSTHIISLTIVRMK